MSDVIDRFADERFDALRRQIREVYWEAAVDVRRKLNKFMRGHRSRAAQMLARVAAGEISEAYYQDWLRGQVFIGDRWRSVLNEITTDYVSADARAREIIGREDREVFRVASNETARMISGHVYGGVSFDMYDDAAVNRLIAQNPQLLPEWKIDEPKDYIWNQQRVQNAVTQGILQGESVQDIGARLTEGLAAQNAGKMQMFARTAVTGAQNAGRVERMQEAEDMGIEVRKKWLAVHDNRTRHDHEWLDRQPAIPPDEDFVTEDGKHIRFPGDPSAPPELTYNCRCTLIYVYPQYGGR